MLITRSPIESPEMINEGDHLVQFYNDDKHLTETVTNFVAPSLMNEEGVLIIATKEHLLQFEASLKSYFNIDFLRLTQQLVTFDAEDILKEFMIDGVLNEAGFIEFIKHKIVEMKSLFPSVKVYGELVNVLWHRKDFIGAIELEKIWCNLLPRFKFTLLCAYRINAIIEENSEHAFSEICRCHTHVIPAEGVIEFESQNDQLRKIAELQYKAGFRTKNLSNWTLIAFELLMPLTAIKTHLLEINNKMNDHEIKSIVHKCEQQLDRITSIAMK